MMVFAEHQIVLETMVCWQCLPFTTLAITVTVHMYKRPCNFYTNTGYKLQISTPKVNDAIVELLLYLKKVK